MEFVVIAEDCFLDAGTVVACDDERWHADQREVRVIRSGLTGDGARTAPTWVPLADLSWLSDGADMSQFWAMRTSRGCSDAGDVGAPAVLFLHAGSLTRHQYRPQVLALASLGFRAISLDMAGHGDYADQEVFTLRASADRCVIHLARLGVRRALVVGTSLGGNVAGYLAARRPDLVAGLFVHGCTTDFSSKEITKFFDIPKILERNAVIYQGYERPWEILAASMKKEQTAARSDAPTKFWREALWTAYISETRLNIYSFNHMLPELHGVGEAPGSAATHAGFGFVEDVRILQPDVDLKPPGQHPLEFFDRQRLANNRRPGQGPLVFEIIEDCGHYWNLEYPLLYLRKVREMAHDVFGLPGIAGAAATPAGAHSPRQSAPPPPISAPPP